VIANNVAPAVSGLGGIDWGLALPLAARLSQKLDGLSRRSDEGVGAAMGLPAAPSELLTAAEPHLRRAVTLAPVAWATATIRCCVHLLIATDPVTRSGWRESVGRVNEQMRLLNEGNLQLTAPFTLNPYGTEFSINCQK